MNPFDVIRNMFSTLRFSQIAAVYQSVMPLGIQSRQASHWASHSGLAQWQNRGRTISTVGFGGIALSEMTNLTAHRPVESKQLGFCPNPVPPQHRACLDTHRVSASEIEKLSV